jgi:predicted AAA+ superfamily ATPase
LNKWDISKYAKREALIIKDIYDLIPSELNQQNKRFILKDMNQHARFNRYQEDFVWLADAGVALPTYSVEEPVYPLKLTRQSNLFKLFMADVGLLTSTFMKDVVEDVLTREASVNYGATYENAVAQELVCAGFDLCYYRNKKMGEVDFIVEASGRRIIPIEVKSGKTYARHLALDNLLSSEEYDLPEGIVLAETNVHVRGQVTYLPVYATGLGALRR